MDEKIKVIIFVRGGVVQEVRASTPDVEIQVADWDNTESDDQAKQNVDRLALESATLYPVY